MGILMEGILLEKVIIYGSVAFIVLVILGIYFFKLRRETKQTEKKISFAKEHGLFEPVSLHPVININSCIRSGACVRACPEKDVLGISSGRGTVINASRCIGHGACFHACPVEAITLCIGTEKRGVDLPHVSEKFETNIKGIYIAGELGGMGLIKNAVEQGRQAVENIMKDLPESKPDQLDLVIIGAGPAGISASLTAKQHKLKFVTLEQDTLGGTVYTFPRSKIVMTNQMDLPGWGKVKLHETSKEELLKLWNNALSKNGIEIRQETKVEEIIHNDGSFIIKTKTGDELKTSRVLLSIGRRGTPRKLGVPGEISEKVAYRLLEPEDIHNKKIMVVGGGDSAVESAMLLADNNKVILSYRSDAFSRIKPGNSTRITKAIEAGDVEVRFSTNVAEIHPESVILKNSVTGEEEIIPNDLVYIFAGGELPTKFLEKVGIKITRKHGEALLKH
ncbi:NAD(P)-binding domain-containing protein [Saccharicrinis sp. FJH62]|uniref:NAD(P)-binding domain-containing protein n=1 Tax=Saccharicrinis sp. FJH62 TaxID=3344657 RepID=UPI0035D4BF54